MDHTQAAAYLARIGAESGPATAETLHALQLAHLSTVPFENLSIHLGEPIVLAEDALFEKIVTGRRGGFCYELNGLFAALLTHLGYSVTLHEARVYGDGRLGVPFDHLALRVELDRPWLVDVGFGDFSYRPLLLDSIDDQADPGGIFRVTPADHGDLDVSQDGRPQYRIDPRPYELSAFVPTCWYQQTSPDSHFTRSLTCSRLTESGRITVSGRRLITTAADGTRTEQALDGDEAIRAAYRAHFGFELDRLPTIP